MYNLGANLECDGAGMPGMAAPRQLLPLIDDIVNHGVREQNRRRVLTGYSYDEFYDWDLYFENLFLSHFGVSAYCRNGIEMFLDQQQPSGFVARTLGLTYPKPRQHFKPFMAQIALLYIRQTGNTSWLRWKYYGRLKKYLDYWTWYCDYDKNGLVVWDSADHSGMDNQDPRCGVDGTMEVEGVDVNVYLIREMQAMAVIARNLGCMDDAAAYEASADTIYLAMETYLWDEADGFFYDRNERTGKPVKLKTIAGLLPLWLPNLPSDKAKRLIAHLTDPELFWTEYPVATWAKNEDAYYQEQIADECNWRGTTWMPTNYMLFHGAMQHGYSDVAERLSNKSFELVNGEEHIREYYNAETGSGQGLNPFWGWSSLALVMQLEFRHAYDPSDHLCEIVPLAKDVWDVNIDI